MLLFFIRKYFCLVAALGATRPSFQPCKQKMEVQETLTSSANAAETDISSSQDGLSLAENIQNQASNISYEIEKIIESKKDEDGKYLYKARWVAYTWIPEDCLLSFQHFINEYWTEKKKLDEETKDDSQDENAIQLMVNVNTSGNQETIVLDESSINVNSSQADSTEKEEFFLVPTERSALSSINVVNSPKTSSIMFCSKCNQRFFLKSNLEVHVLFCEGVKTNPAVSQTESELSTQSTVSSEEVLLSDSQTFEYVPMDVSSGEKCDACSQRFPEGTCIGSTLTDIAQLLAQSRKKIISDKVEVYECDECNREFLYKHPIQTDSEQSTQSDPTKDSIDVDAKQDKASKAHKCSICNRGFDLENDMLEHEVKHANTPSRYTCGSCNEKFVTRDALQQHYNAEDNECKPRKCDVCDRTFIHANHLKRHLSIHAGVKPFICTICGHEFNQKSDLYRHEKRHTVDGKLSCSKCVQDFDSIEELREHVKIHKRDENTKQNYTCERCGKSFGRKSHYKRHLSIHDGLKPHTCEQCGKSFNQRTDLKRHHTSHLRRDIKGNVALLEDSNQDETFVCNICSKVFLNRATYLEHDIIHQKIMNTGVY